MDGGRRPRRGRPLQAAFAALLSLFISYSSSSSVLLYFDHSLTVLAWLTSHHHICDKGKINRKRIAGQSSLLLLVVPFPRLILSSSFIVSSSSFTQGRRHPLARPIDASLFLVIISSSCGLRASQLFACY